MSEAVPVGLVRRARRGDPRALNELLRLLLPELGRICGAIALDRGDDALQETMIAVMRHIGSLKQPAAVRGWARRIAVREAIRQAAQTPAVPVDPQLLDRGAAGGEPQTAVEVWDALGSLTPDQRAVLVLQHFGGLTEQEIAGALGVPPGTVKSRLHRARQAFRARWAGE